MLIQNTKDIYTNGIKCLIYGESGTGKTRLCATAPNPIIFSAENGLLSLQEFSVPYVKIESFKQMIDCYNWALKSKEAKKYDTLCLDSASDIAETLLLESKPLHKDPRKAYGDVQDAMLELFKHFRDLPEKCVYFSAKCGRVKDEKTGSFLFGPMFPGDKFSLQVPYLFDEIFYAELFINLETGEKTTGLKTYKDAQTQGKDRSGKLSPWERGNLLEIFTKIIT